MLKKVSVGEAPPRLSLVLPEDPFMFQRGYFVKVTNNLEQMMELQPGHGEWVDTMKQVSMNRCCCCGCSVCVCGVVCITRLSEL